MNKITKTKKIIYEVSYNNIKWITIDKEDIPTYWFYYLQLMGDFFCKSNDPNINEILNSIDNNQIKKIVNYKFNKPLNLIFYGELK